MQARRTRTYSSTLYILHTFHRVASNSIEGGGWYGFAAPLPDAHPRLAGTLLLRPLHKTQPVEIGAGVWGRAGVESLERRRVDGSEEAGLRKEQQRGGHAARAAHGAAPRAGAGARAQGSGGGPGARPPDAGRQPGRGRAVPAGPGRVGAGVAGGHRLRRRPAAERNDGLEKRLEELEGVVEAQGKEMRVGRRAAEDAMRAVRDETARALRELETRLAQPQANGSAQGEAATPRPGQPRRRATLRREFPDLVTREPAEDDEEVFGDAWTLIVEWRALKAAHPSRGKGPSWLATQERLLTVELALLEEHGMTLPPETYPLRGFARDGQTGWRRTALYDTRRARARWELLRRVLTLWLWRK